MSRRYADPVEVERADTTPARFVWRGRLYLVRSVLAHWVESGGWWRDAGPAVLDDAEREFWRVEAAAGRSFPVGVYDLCFQWSHGMWTIARALD